MWLAAFGIGAAVALPAVLWHRVIADIAAAFEPDLRYLVVGWSPWVLMLLGLGCLATSALVEHRRRAGRFYAASGAAWAGWGTTLYVLGFGLATQVAQIAHGFAHS